MRFNVHLRSEISEQIDALAEVMKAWEEQPRVNSEEQKLIEDNLCFFNHTTSRKKLRVGGVDGTGDLPSLTYADSFIYVTVANGTIYDANAATGLKEVGPQSNPLVHFAWLPEDSEVSRGLLDDAFALLAGMTVQSVVEESDYRVLKAVESGRPAPTDDLIDTLIRPHASDTGNIGLQLRSTAELGMAYRFLEQYDDLDYLLIDGTLSLPLVSATGGSLFYEHLKRLCCKKAREMGVGLFAISKSHGIPSIGLLENIAQSKAGLAQSQTAEHWYLRIPTMEFDGWTLSLAAGRRLPPPGAVSYLVRFHRTTPVMRLDMDYEFWSNSVRAASLQETCLNECRAFEDLDYASHDQRSYGYPYPIKASHDRASLTKPERIALRKQIIDAAIQAGLRRSLFQDASRATGYGGSR